MRNDEATLLRQRLATEHDEHERATLLHTLVHQWPDDPRTRSLLHELVHTDQSFLVRDQAMRSLALHWRDERSRDALQRVITTDPEYLVAKEAGAFLHMFWPGEAESWTRECLASPDPGTRLRALSTMRNQSPADPDTLTALRTATADDDARVRTVALRELGDLLDSMRLADADSHAVIRDRAAHDTSPDVRVAALQAVGATRDPEAFDLVRHAVAAPEPAVRAAAVSALRGYRATHRATIASTLYERATTDDDPNVRAAAMFAMARRPDEPRMWPDTPEAVAWLRDHVAADPFAEDRHNAVKYLLGDFVDDPGVRALLFRIAEHHPRTLIRLDVIHTLTRGAPGDDTLELLTHLASTNPEPDVRQRLIVEIVQALEDDDDAVTEFLTTRAEQDPDPGIREFATNLLDDPEETLDPWH